MRPLCIDLFCGLGGWAEGFLAEGYDVIGFDIERHDYGTGGYPGWLVLQDVMTLHGSQFRDAAVIVASPPCQKYSYMAMPWMKAKALAAWYREDPERIRELTALFDASFRIAEEAGIPLILENVRGAQPWVGPAKWNYGSFYLWGDLPALMPMTAASKVPGLDWSQFGQPGYKAQGFNVVAAQRYREGIKLPGNNGPQRWEDRQIKRLCDATKGIPHAPTGHWTNPRENGSKNGGDWFGSGDDCSLQRRAGSKSDSRKAASAQIAKIPFPLARHIARCFQPQEVLA